MIRLRFLIVAVLASFAAPLAAVDDAPLFPIDAIAVEGARYSSRTILVAESKLREGATYSEPQLRDAVARINRLPFVLHTDFRLEKGSERGRYVLVITIVETKPLFVSYRALYEGIETFQLVGVEPGDFGEPPKPIIERTIFRHNEDDLTVGARTFLGAKGLLYGSFERQRDRYNLGYTHYDLFGTRATINFLLQYRDFSYGLPSFVEGVERRTTTFRDHLAWEVSGAMPLFGNNAIRASWYRQKQPYTVPVPGGSRVIRLRFDHPEVVWIYDTTNDPIFPTSGMYARGGLDIRGTFRDTRGGPRTQFREGWSTELNAHAAKFWELTSRQSILSGADVATFSNREQREVRFRAGYALTLRDSLRFEAQAERILDPVSSYNIARIGLAYRNTWGIAHLDFQYLGWRQ